MTVHIVLNTDDNYALPTVVAVTSLLHNKKSETDYAVYVLTDNISEPKMAFLQALPGVKIIPHINRFSKKYSGTHRHVSSADLSKFDLPELFPDIDKILYIDSDMIVQKDLSELYNQDISDVYAGAVLDMRAELRGHHTRIGNKRYFNNGMMLLNLKKMRDEQISQKLCADKLADDSVIFMTQDAFNRVFGENVAYLPPRFNYMGPNLADYAPDELQKFFGLTEEEYQNLVRGADIVHFTNRVKPWNCAETWGAELWIGYYRLSPLKNLPLPYEN